MGGVQAKRIKFNHEVHGHAWPQGEPASRVLSAAAVEKARHNHLLVHTADALTIQNMSKGHLTVYGRLHVYDQHYHHTNSSLSSPGGMGAGAAAARSCLPPPAAPHWRE